MNTVQLGLPCCRLRPSRPFRFRVQKPTLPYSRFAAFIGLASVQVTVQVTVQVAVQESELNVFLTRPHVAIATLHR